MRLVHVWGFKPINPKIIPKEHMNYIYFDMDTKELEEIIILVKDYFDKKPYTVDVDHIIDDISVIYNKPPEDMLRYDHKAQKVVGKSPLKKEKKGVKGKNIGIQTSLFS